jgi:hypothetical protein
VQELTVAFRVGTLTEQNLRDFIKTELHHLRRGEPLRHDVAIAALAVALESSPSAFASEFVTGLAALEIVEMQQSVLMAKECAKHRKAAPCTVRKTFEVEVAPTTSEPRAIVPLVDEGRRFRPPNTFEKHSDLNDAHATP